jgi:hypothetical protein
VARATPWPRHQVVWAPRPLIRINVIRRGFRPNLSWRSIESAR